jgi:hypothetical protein
MALANQTGRYALVSNHAPLSSDASRRLERRVRSHGDELTQLAERRMMPRMVSTPNSLGELIDKITILRIKAEQIGSRKNSPTHRELTLLERRRARTACLGHRSSLLMINSRP